jgi:hypothetical protein
MRRRFTVQAAFRMVFLHAVTIFVGAALLFLVQPMFARLVLPLLGGSPAVWATALVFFQGALLAGYAYVHASVAWLGVRRQAVLHLAVLLLPFAVLPVAVPGGWTPPVEANPVPWVLALMAVAVGLPFFVVSTTSPLLQTWFAASGHRSARDPYFLYVASNAGSLLALLSYPCWVEPRLALVAQTRGWMWGYAGLALLIGGCAVALLKGAPAAERDAAPVVAPVPSARQRARWVLLAFVPSSLLLGVTTYLSSEVAAVPLLWVIPLALYLLTFVIVFARRERVPRTWLGRALPIGVAPLVAALNLQATAPIGWLMGLHLAVFFVAAWLCHARLAAERPAAARLTEFYLWLSVGGVAGGAFNALVAPVVFHSLVEYPLALVLACAVGLGQGAPVGVRRGDWLWPLALGGATAAAVIGMQAGGRPGGASLAGLIFGGAALGAYLLSRRPLRFALAVGAVLGAGSLYQGERGRVLDGERSFFGVHRVTLDPTGRFHLLVHGLTLHGRQSLEAGRRDEPLTYYHRTGPIGDVLAAVARDPAKKIGVVGLGAGSLASYAAPRQAWTFFEIDPVVVGFARDGRYFTFLRDSPGDVKVVLGDGRRSLAAQPEGAFDVLILDAYSSDAIPVHLVTREALALYRHTLAPGGVLAFHISNLHLDLEPVFANLAREARLVCLTRDDTGISAAELAQGKSPSVWLVMARRATDLGALARDPRWVPAQIDPAQARWTDDYSSLLSVLRWR